MNSFLSHALEIVPAIILIALQVHILLHIFLHNYFTRKQSLLISIGIALGILGLMPLKIPFISKLYYIFMPGCLFMGSGFALIFLTFGNHWNEWNLATEQLQGDIMLVGVLAAVLSYIFLYFYEWYINKACVLPRFAHYKRYGWGVIISCALLAGVICNPWNWTFPDVFKPLLLVIVYILKVVSIISLFGALYYTGRLLFHKVVNKGK